MQRPVLLIHGIYDTHKIFDKMRAAFSTHGIRDVAAVDIVPSDASITYEEMARQVSAAVDALLQRTSAPQIDLVGFSMGAIAARQYFQTCPEPSRIRKYISIAGPQHGTLVAYAGRRLGARQMRPRSAFMRELNREEGEWGAISVYSIWSPFDLMVMPARSSLLKRAANISIPVPFHNLLVSDARVIQTVGKILMGE